MNGIVELLSLLFQLVVVAVVLTMVGVYTSRLLNRIADRQAAEKARSAAVVAAARRHRKAIA